MTEFKKRGRYYYATFTCVLCDQQFERRRDSRVKYPDQCKSCTSSKHLTNLKTTHGYYGTPTYVSWRKMKERCLNESHRYFYLYGGRGITVCEKWLSFEGFLEDMGETPKPGYSIDRIDNDQGYHKDNCRWLPRNEQQKNRRPSKTWEKKKTVGDVLRGKKKR